MDFFGIPAEVVDAYVLPNLGWNDLLRLRRVCKWTKAITDGYLKVHPELAPEIEINEEDKDFRAFLKMGIPTTRIYLNNPSGYDFFGKGGEDMLEFLEDFGPFVKFLRLDQISLLMFGMETEFLDALKNLQSLEAKRYGGYPRDLDPAKAIDYVMMKWKETPEDSWKVPLNRFERLTALKIGNNDDAVLDLDEDVFAFVDKLLEVAEALEWFALPFSLNAKPLPDFLSELTEQQQDLHSRPMVFAFTLLMSHMMCRSTQDPPLASYKEIDFVSYHQDTGVDQKNQFFETWMASPLFLSVCNLCVEKGVKLQNVDSAWFVSRNCIANQERNTPKLGIPVRSLVNLHPGMLSLDMPNLERIQIRSTSRCTVEVDWSVQRPAWPSLKSLDINVDSASGASWNWDPTEQHLFIYKTATMGILNFFFHDFSRTALTDLRLEFQEKAVDVIPNTVSIVSACPNLKKLTLVKWPGKNKALTKLWSGLPALEEISLEYCTGLGNVAFVGEDVASPVFLKLGKLKKLSLKGLDQMPKITDTLFSLVIRHTKLTHLVLTSETPIKSVTFDGVRSLADGDFADSVQKFPFKNWSLENVTKEEFKKLEDMFRSSKML